MKNPKILLLILALVIGSAWFVKRLAASQKELIGILQTASHPALDRARQAFASQFPADQIKYQNAEGLATQAQAIAANFHSDPNIRAIYVIGTPAAQAMASIEKEKPIIFAAVSDPKAAGLMQGNITGVSDKVPAHKQIVLIREMLPYAKRLALLYNPAEANSVVQIEEMKKAAQSSGIEVVLVGVASPSEVVTATQSAAQKADAILVPTDNLLVSAMVTVARVALENKKPLFVSDPPSVERGAAACLGVDYTKSGKDAAALLRLILNGAKPSDLPVITEDNPPRYMNKITLAELGLKEAS